MTVLLSGASTKFKLIKKVDGEVRVYQGKTARTGDVVEFSGDFAVKAALNPDYELYKDANTSIEPKSVEPEPVEPEPVELEPVELEPVELEPVELEPVELDAEEPKRGPGRPPKVKKDL